MSATELFAAYWWLLFPIFGMVMAIIGMGNNERLTKSTLELIKSYVDQGKDPPPELLRRAAQGLEDGGVEDGKGSPAWPAIVFTAIAAGAVTGWWFMREESWSFALLIAAVTMGVMALGALLILIFGKKS